MNRGDRGAGRGHAGSANASSSSRATPSASATPSVTPARTPGATRASRGASAVTGRFRPKIVRRNEAERDSIAREEEKKASERLAEERRARGRSRFRSTRSRGDAMGRGRGRGGAVAAAAGPFASGFGGASGRIGGGGGFYGGGGGGGGGGMGSGAGGTSRGKSERRIQSLGEGNDGPREPRINADKLHTLEQEDDLDSDDEAMLAALSARASVMPMGIYRKIHKEAGVVVATTAELEAAENAGEEEESLWVDGTNTPDTQPPPEQPAEEGVWDTGDKKPVVVKPDPDSETATADKMDVDQKPEAVLESKEDKPKLEVKVKKAPPQDSEERVIQSDLNLLASELGAITVTDESGEIKAEGPADKDGRMYLFQFPPLLPPLKPGPAPQSSKNKVKAEPEEFNMADAPPAPAAGDTAPVDLTEDAAAAEDEEDEDDGQGFMSSLLSEGGMMGKLNVRRSGKVELDWGGKIMELSPATGMNFLSTAVIVEQSDEKAAPGVIGGEGIGMGKIMGRFVVAPVWGEEEDWEVAPEELSVTAVEGG